MRAQSKRLELATDCTRSVSVVSAVQPQWLLLQREATPRDAQAGPASRCAVRDADLPKGERRKFLQCSPSGGRTRRAREPNGEDGLAFVGPCRYFATVSMRNLTCNVETETEAVRRVG